MPPPARSISGVIGLAPEPHNASRLLTLKKEATNPPSFNALQQQERFDGFIAGYNHDRPHQAYLALSESRQRIDVAEEGLNAAAENLRMVRDRYREGLINNTEVLDAETLLTKSDSNLANAKYDAVLADLMLKRAIGSL